MSIFALFKRKQSTVGGGVQRNQFCVWHFTGKREFLYNCSIVNFGKFSASLQLNF